MKYPGSILALTSMITALFFLACGTPQGVPAGENAADNTRVTVIQNPQSLEDFLVRAPGVIVQGNEVSIRGGGTPLFVIDDVPIGNSYLSAVSALNPLDIESVEVISGPETAIYGRRGANGVIIIRTKTGN